MVDPPQNLSDAGAMTSARALLEATLALDIERAVTSVLGLVFDDAAAALDAGTLLAAGTGKPGPAQDPFSFTQVMKRWRAGMGTLADMISTREGVERLTVYTVLEESDLPKKLHADVVDLLIEAKAKKWTQYQTKRALSKALVPKETSGRWSTRAQYRAYVQGLARTLATQTLNRKALNDMRARGITEKTWFTRQDPQVRPTHRVAHGQTVHVQQEFSVGGYGLAFPGDPTAPLHETVNCRCVMIAVGNPTQEDDVSTAGRKARPKKAATTATAATRPRVTVTFAGTTTPAPAAVTAAALATDTGPVMWSGIIGMEDTLTGDGRYIDAEALSWETPLPLRYVAEDTGGHDGARAVGTILHIERVERGEEDGGIAIYASGTFDGSPEGAEAARLVADGVVTGVSMDLDNVTFEVRVKGELYDRMQAMFEEDGTAAQEEPERDSEGRVKVFEGAPDDEVQVMTDARIRAATIVTIPAFAEAVIGIAEDDDSDAGDGAGDGGEAEPTPSDSKAIDEAVDEALAADTGGEGEDAALAATLAATFNWVEDTGGLPEYIRRIADRLIEGGMAESRAIATAVNTVKRWARGGTVRANGGPRVSAETAAKAAAALAEWEAKKAAAKASSSRPAAVLSAQSEGQGQGQGAEDDPLTPSVTPALVASALAIEPPDAPPAAWFDSPALTGPTPLTITDEGRVYGHLATWDTCHVAFPDQCTSPPRSTTGYSYFHTGVVVTDTGAEVSVGQVTLGTGHAPSDAAARGATAHYENTGAAVADVRAGEDSHGIWVSGALRPGVSPRRLRALRAAPLSGDWRRVNGNLELVAALAVNVPGFPVPRAGGRLSGGRVVSLVASGLVPPPLAALGLGEGGEVPADGVERTHTLDRLTTADLAYLRALAARERARHAASLAARANRPRVDALAQRLSEM